MGRHSLDRIYGVLAVAASLTLSACASDTKPVDTRSPYAVAGEGVARRNCGECHTLNATGPSPLADAPTFRTLKARYPREKIEPILAQRSVEVHPRMPQLKLDPDELAQFLDYWDTIPSPVDDAR